MPKFPRILHYKGSLYDRVGADATRYRSARYVLAADPLITVEDIRKEQEDIEKAIASGKLKNVKKALKRLEYLQKELPAALDRKKAQEEQAAKENAAPTEPSPEDQKAEQEKQTKEALQALVRTRFGPFVKNLEQHAKDTLSAVGVLADPVQLDTIEEDGIDVVGDIKKGNISSLSGVVTITMDYAIDFSGVDEVKITLPEKESGPPVVPEIVKHLPNLTDAEFKLNEIIVHLCDHNFAAHTKDEVEGLLRDGVGFFQTAKTMKVEKGALLTPSKEKVTEEEQREWLKKIMQEVVKRKLNELVGVQVRQRSEWSKIDRFERTIKGLQEDKYLPADTAKKIFEMLGKLGQSNYSQLMREAVRELGTPVSQGPKALKQTVENAVKELTQHESYTGSIEVGYSDDNKIVGTIVAPYKMQYYFDKAGVNLKLVRAEMEFCDSRFVVTSVDEAKKLLTANLELYSAYGRAVNPSLSQISEKSDLGELSRKIYDLIEKSDIGEEPSAPTYAPKPSAPATPPASPATPAPPT